MTHTPQLAGLVITLIAAIASPAAAQSAAMRVVGRDEHGRPLVMTEIDGRTIGAFARAAGVPMGLEIATGTTPRSRRALTLTGMTSDRALQAIAGLDRRYEMREVDGVFVLRTREAWEQSDHPLTAAAPSIRLEDVRARNGLSLVAALLGAPQYRNIELGDTRRFALNVEGGTVLDVMNAAVRAHGNLAWVFESRSRDELFPYMVSMYSGGFGVGCGVPGVPPKSAVNVASYADPPASLDASSVLDRIVPHDASGRPVVVNGPFPTAIRDLAQATKVPMGIEFLGPGDRPITSRITASGQTLHAVLDAIVAVDPRYEWRDLRGVIVVRPATAWNDLENVLARPTPAVRLIDVTPQAAVEALAKHLNHPSPIAGIPNGTPLSIDEPPGTVLDLANAILRAHGELWWELSPATDTDSIRTDYRYGLTIGAFGGGGFGIGVR